MAKAFARGDIVLAAGVARRVTEILTTGGYTGGMLGKYLLIDPQGNSDVFRGDNAAMDQSSGIPMDGVLWFKAAMSLQLVIDPSNIWLFSVGGATISVSFEEL